MMGYNKTYGNEIMLFLLLGIIMTIMYSHLQIEILNKARMPIVK